MNDQLVTLISYYAPNSGQVDFFIYKNVGTSVAQGKLAGDLRG